MINLTSKYPKLLTHKGIFNSHEFFGSGHFIVTKDLTAFVNRCPHRGNKIINPGAAKENFECGLHGWAWGSDGCPKNNNVNLRSKNVSQGDSGIIFLDWEEPKDAKWVKDLASDYLEYSHSTKRYGEGDWRWQMEMHVDLLHVSKIHPLLNNYVDCNNLDKEIGYDWVCQHHEHGWWLFVYPFTHIEWEPGCLYFSEIAPRENDKGYDVFIHYLFNPTTDQETRKKFIEIAETTFDEDIKAVNELSASSKYRMPSNASDPLEEDIHHFYNWLEDNIE